MKTATRKDATRRIYQDGNCGGEEGLRYFKDRFGLHVVVHSFASDEPNIYRHQTIEAARETWSNIARDFADRGMTWTR
jgi:hypothetical protein